MWVSKGSMLQHWYICQQKQKKDNAKLHVQLEIELSADDVEANPYLS